MNVTEHGVSSPFFKGVTNHYGKDLVFFGRSRAAVMEKEQNWLRANAPTKPKRAKPALRVVQGGVMPFPHAVPNH